MSENTDVQIVCFILNGCSLNNEESMSAGQSWKVALFDSDQSVGQGQQAEAFNS